MTVNHPNTPNVAREKKIPRAFLFLNVLTTANNAKSVTNAVMMTRPINPTPFRSV